MLGDGLISSRRWRSLVALLAALGIGALLWINPYGKSPVNQGLGLLLVLLGILPLWRWTRDPSIDAVPVLGLIGFFYALCYALAGLVTPDIYMSDIVVAETDYTPALLAALVSWGALNAGFALGKRFSPRRVPKPFSRLDPRHDGVALWFGYPVSLLANQVVVWLGLIGWVQITGALHGFFFIWVLHAAWSGRFTIPVRRLVLVVLLPLDLLLYLGLTEGMLAGLLVFGQLIGLTYAVTKGRLPYLPLVMAVGLFLVLQPVKGAYRFMTWHSDVKVGLVEGGMLLGRLALEYHTGPGTAPFSESLNGAYSRINLLHATAAIMADTAAFADFRGGETYLPLLTKWIPRAFWSAKPREDLGNRWARDYGYLSPEDDVTSFNLPWLPEMYMNYSWTGVVVISFLVGSLAALVWSRLAKSQPSPVFAAGLVLLSAFFFAESNLSIAIGKLVTDGLAIAAVCWLISLMRRYRPRHK